MRAFVVTSQVFQGTALEEKAGDKEVENCCRSYKRIIGKDNEEISCNRRERYEAEDKGIVRENRKDQGSCSTQENRKDN